MLTPDYLDTLPDALVELWQQVEDDILRDIARRIAKADEVTETAAYQLWRFEETQALHQFVAELLTQYSGKSDAELRALLREAGIEALASDDELYRSLGFSPSDVSTSEALNNLLDAGYRQTRGTWKNLTATTANTVTGEFERALDRAWLQISSGAFDYKTAVKRAVDSLADHMAGVTYPSGHRDTLEVAARRAVLTGVNQTAAQLQLARADEMGCEFVETSAHAGARPEHAVWQGRVFHRGGTVVYQGKEYEDFETHEKFGIGEISRTELEAMQKVSGRKMEKLKDRLDSAQEKYADRKKEYELYIAGIKAVYRINGVTSLDRETLVTLIDRIVIHPTGDFEITWNFEKGFRTETSRYRKGAKSL